MRKFFITVFLVGMYFLNANAQTGEVSLGLGIIDPTSQFPGENKAPVAKPLVWQDGYQLTLSNIFIDYIFCLFDEDGELVYSTYVPAGTTVVYLPTTLSGEFEIRLVTSSFYFYGYITL